MSEEMKLSQAEIDALLGAKTPPTPPLHDILTTEDKDALGEIGNISFGSAATSLSMLLQQRVDITTPTVSVLNPEDVPNDFPRPYVLVSVEYTSGVTGTNALAIELNDAKTIADLMLGGDGHNTAGELNDLHLSAVAEAMNQMMGGAATAMSTMLNCPINISPPKVRFVDLSGGDTDLGISTPIVNTAFRLRVGDLIDSKLMQLVPVSFATELLSLLRNTMAAEQAAAAASSSAVASAGPTHAANSVAAPPRPMSPSSGVAQEVPRQPVVAAVPQPAWEDQSNPYSPRSTPSPTLSVQRPEFMSFADSEPTEKAPPRNLALLFDVNLNVTVELGRTRKSIREILDLSPGSIIELDKLAGEPVDILVNDKRVAIGEVVVIDENFGVRVTDIISPMERVRKLQ